MYSYSGCGKWLGLPPAEKEKRHLAQHKMEERVAEEKDKRQGKEGAAFDICERTDSRLHDIRVTYEGLRSGKHR